MHPLQSQWSCLARQPFFGEEIMITEKCYIYFAMLTVSGLFMVHYAIILIKNAVLIAFCPNSSPADHGSHWLHIMIR